MTNVTSAFQGITTPTADLYQQIAQTGWQTSKVKFDKTQDVFVAEAKNPHGEVISRTGPNDRTALGNLLVAIMRRHHIRSAAQWKLGMWKTMFTDQLQPIAEAYAKAPVYDPKAAGAFMELAQDSTRRANVLRGQLQIEVVDDPEPYANAKEMADDIHNKKHFKVSRANSEHPVWTVEQNVDFRIVHDVLGHAVSGGDFGWQGENLACAAHFPLLTVTAQQALFTECIAQTAYASFYRSFGPQKVALFPQFTDPSQAAENDPAHTGIHPSQSTAPTEMPAIPPSVEPEAHGAWPEGGVAPHQEGFGLTPVMNPTSKVANSSFTDPNADWSSGIDPMQLQTHGVGNAYLDHGDPLGAADVMDTAGLIDTKWHSLKDAEGNFDVDRAKQAVVNAFRVVLLSPRKDLRWNAIHYQDIDAIPASTADPKVYWDTLEAKRRAWNSAQGIDPDAHMPYFKFVKPFEAVIRAKSPELSFTEAKEKAERVLFDMWTEEQQRIIEEDEEKPEDKQKTIDEVERRANEALAKRLKNYLKPKDDKTDEDDTDPAQISLLGSNAQRVETDDPRFDGVQVWEDDKGFFVATRGKSKSYESLEAIPDSAITKIRSMGKTSAGGQYNLLTGEEGLKYGAFMGTHLKAISKISQHSDELLDAALEDVKSHDGKGYHFRAKVLQLNISGVGPKVASFAWLLLQPLTSQLATIDIHMMDVLGHNYEKEMSNRDYFKFERELAAGRDAAGYGHVPLGAFQWGMWDHKRTGPGSHQDHSAMRVLDPVPHQLIDWASKGENLKGADWHDQAPDWWKNTQPAREAVAEDFSANVAPGVSKGNIPYRIAEASTRVAAKEDAPNKKTMKLLTDKGLSTPEVWAVFPDVDEPEGDEKASETSQDNSWDAAQLGAI